MFAVCVYIYIYIDLVYSEFFPRCLYGVVQQQRSRSRQADWSDDSNTVEAGAGA